MSNVTSDKHGGKWVEQERQKTPAIRMIYGQPYKASDPLNNPYWWINFLKEKGFEEKLSQHFNTLNYQFKKYEISLWTRYERTPRGKSPAIFMSIFFKKVNTPYLLMTKENFPIIEGFLDAIDNSDSMSLLVGNDWLAPVLEAYFKDQEQ